MGPSSEPWKEGDSSSFAPPTAQTQSPFSNTNNNGNISGQPQHANHLSWAQAGLGGGPVSAWPHSGGVLLQPMTTVTSNQSQQQAAHSSGGGGPPPPGQAQGGSNPLSSGIPMANLFPSQLVPMNMQSLQQQVVMGSAMGSTWYPIYPPNPGTGGLSREQEANWGTGPGSVPMGNVAMNSQMDVQSTAQSAQPQATTSNLSQGYPAMPPYPVGMGAFGMSTWTTPQTYGVIPTSLQPSGQSPSGSPQLSPLTPAHFPPSYQLPDNSLAGGSHISGTGGIFGSQSKPEEVKSSTAHQLQFGSMPIEELARPGSSVESQGNPAKNATKGANGDSLATTAAPSSKGGRHHGGEGGRHRGRRQVIFLLSHGF